MARWSKVEPAVTAPFVWRCLNSRTITPFPHPPHQTGQAVFRHPAFGQDSRLRTRKVRYNSLDPRHRAVYPGVQQSSVLHLTANAATWAVIRFPNYYSGSFFTSACDTCRSFRTLPELSRVAPISRASLLSVPVLNQGPFPPPALPGFFSNTGLSATP